VNADIHVHRLIKVFQAANGSRSKIVVLTEALSDERLTDDEAWAEADYLAGEHWVEIVGDNGPAWVRLTHEGIKKAETYLIPSLPAPASLPNTETHDESAVSYNFPKIELSDVEQEWVGNVCSYFLKGYLVDVNQLKKSLNEKGKWSRGFRPSEIDSRLLQAMNHPTLLGVWHAYPVPHNKWIQKCDQLIGYLKERVEAASSREIKVSEIAQALGWPAPSISVLIRLLPSLGFGYTATSALPPNNRVRIPGEMSVYTSLRIDDPEQMDDYLSYMGIEEQVQKVFGADDQIPPAQLKMVNDNLILDRYELIQPLIGFKKNIESQLARFPFEENVFLMMKFRPSNKDLSDFIIENLQSHGLRGVRADANDWNITRNVYNPISVLYCCKYGIALFDEPEKDQTYSPNVAYELGIMHYQQKECLILRHASLSAVPFDLVKDLYVTYEKDLQVRRIIGDWVKQITGR
jgi:hypothetical protein